MTEVLAGRYRFVRPIGEGGTGVVYLAEDLNLGRPVVIKRMKLAGDSRAAQNEIDLLKNLHHNNLVQVYDLLYIGDEVYNVVEYVEGTDLVPYLTGTVSTLPEQVVRDWLWQLCDVLNYLHTRRPAIIHSDIKPGNIMVTNDGRIMLIDFNISFMTGQKVRGFTNGYASPEQVRYVQLYQAGESVRGITIDERSDLYSLAATFYHIISGVMPDPLLRPRPLREMNLPYSEGLLEIIDRAMEPDPRQRYKSARQMADALIHDARDRRLRVRYMWRQVLVTFLGLAFIASGAVCVVLGRNKIVQASYYDTYRAMISAANVNDLESMQTLAQELLYSQEYEVPRAQYSTVSAEAYTVMGEVFYRQQEYGLAAEYYRSAIAVSPDSKIILRYVMSLARGGGTAEETEAAIAEYGPWITDTAQLTALQVELKNRQGDYEGALDLIRGAGSNLSPELYESGAYAAEKLGLWDEAAEYLDAYFRLSGEIYYLDREGQAWYNAAKTADSASLRAAYFENALSCFERINAVSPGIDSLLWQGQILYHLQRYGDSIQVLRDLLGQTSEPKYLYEIYMYLALATYQQSPESGSDIEDYCTRAIENYNLTPQADRLPVTSDPIEQLRKLADTFGVTAVIS